MFLLSDICIAIASIIFLTMLYFKWAFSYWKRKGVPYLEPSIPFGNVRRQALQQITVSEQYQIFYQNMKRNGWKHGGAYMFGKPIYIPIDPELIKHIMIKDFQYFVNRRKQLDPKIDPMNAHLVCLEGDKWRSLRTKLTPTFTSGKLKMMFQTMVDCSLELEKVVGNSIDNNQGIEIKEILSRFATDIIASCAFGLDCNSLKDPNNIFRQKSKLIFETTMLDGIKAYIRMILPLKILTLIKFKQTKPEVQEFFTKIVNDTVRYREDNNIFRKDFMHLLIQLKNTGQVNEDDNDSDISKNCNSGDAITMDELTAQAFVFFAAGFETSSSAMTFAMYELALNQDLQDRVRSEIRTILKKYDGKYTYDSLSEMDILEHVIQESLRKYPISIISRICTKQYQVPNTDVVLDKGTFVVLPVTGLHSDAEYYPDPEVFDPDRFTEENKSKRPPCTWLGFGDGPRNCIGLRFGMMQSKVGLATMLNKYKFTLNSKTRVPLEFIKTTKFTCAKDGVYLNVYKAE